MTRLGRPFKQYHIFGLEIISCILHHWRQMLISCTSVIYIAEIVLRVVRKSCSFLLHHLYKTFGKCDQHNCILY